ncbi:MAG: GGDEF domain-containing protein [Thermodesulfobacteriota bacterium]|nr:GGDEF domain-containing protein [Thermodesulfobacteriota bacterium]
MKLQPKFLIPALLIVALSGTTLANNLWAGMEGNRHTNLTIMLASIAVTTIIILITYRTLVNSRLDKLLEISMQHFPDQRLNQNQKALCHDKLDEVISSFQQMSAEIDKREKALIESVEFSTTILNSISEAVAVIDPDSRTIITVNPAFLRMYNISLGDAIGAPCHEATRCNSIENENTDSSCPGSVALSSQSPYKADRTGIFNGEQHFFEVCATPIFNNKGETIQLIRVARDITKAKKQEQKIRRLAYHDTLTGLPNRTLFKDRLEQALLLSTRNDSGNVSSGILAFLDLDEFKSINDNFGHAAGDELLKIVATRLNACIRESDTVARMGGDEFLVIFHNVTNDKHASTLAEQILSALNKPIILFETTVTISASIGLCFFPKHGTTFDELLKCADEAMYKAKNVGRNTFYIANNDKPPK